MLKIKLIFLSLVLLFSCDNAVAVHRHIREPVEIPVLFRVNGESFPKEWRGEDINAQGVDLDSVEMERSAKIVGKALAKYPDEVLAGNLKEVYVLHSIKFYDVEYGGTNSNDVVYLSNKGTENGYDDLYLEKTFHHEFSSVLLRNYPDQIKQQAWEELNDFAYFDESGGVNSIKNETDGLEYDPKYLEAGFLYQYAASCFENDLNSIAENVFCPTKEYLNFLKKYPKIKKKHDLFIGFYGTIHESFDADYFKAFEEK
ncbi:MAG: hypothetical protein K0R65_227 [Crocinitomicaceae bacterium]|jgi:hypothetical protein|nr:hypothetical protein [Crocinitomicaceae bacterium]